MSTIPAARLDHADVTTTAEQRAAARAYVERTVANPLWRTTILRYLGLAEEES